MGLLVEGNKPMRSIDFPFRFGPSGLALTENYSRIVRAQLVDTLMTNYRERIMRPDYGADIQSLLFNPADELRRDDSASIIQERLTYAVPRAIIDLVEIEGTREPSVVVVKVVYRVNSYTDPETLTVPVRRGGTSG
jgi:uncharacterized protein